MSTLHIQLLGDFRLIVDGELVVGLENDHQLLLAYLLLYRHQTLTTHGVTRQLWPNLSVFSALERHKALRTSFLTSPLVLELKANAHTAMRQPPLPPNTPLQAAKVAYDGLTRREREVAIHIASGKTNRAIAETLIIGERTVEGYVSNILSKLHFTSRTQIAAWAVGKGLFVNRDHQ